MGYIDIHSHILPHMDDGASDMKMTLEMMRIAQDEGITDIIVTPHYRQGRFPADRAKQLSMLQKVRKMLKEEGIAITLYTGNEIYYRSELDEKFEAGELCTMNQSDYVLTEFSPMEDYMYIRSAVEDFFGMGYIPILAHVERYQCLCRKPEYVEQLKKMGCEIQVNAASVTGGNGFASKRFVHKLLKEGLVDYIGTDAHNAERRKPAMRKCADVLYKKYGQKYADALLFGNAEERLLDE